MCSYSIAMRPTQRIWLQVRWLGKLEWSLSHFRHIRLIDSSLWMWFFGPFGKYYDDALWTWMREHVGRPVTTRQVAEILNVAYRKAVSVQNAVTGFRKTGLWSLTIVIDIFQDSDFAAATVTNVITEAVQEHNTTLPDRSH